MMRSRPRPPFHRHQCDNDTLSLSPSIPPLLRSHSSTLNAPTTAQVHTAALYASPSLQTHPRHLVRSPSNTLPSRRTHPRRLQCTSPYCTCSCRFKRIPAAFDALSLIPTHPHHIIRTPIMLYASPSCRTYYHRIEHIPVASNGAPIIPCNYLYTSSPSSTQYIRKCSEPACEPAGSLRVV